MKAILVSALCVYLNIVGAAQDKTANGSTANNGKPITEVNVSDGLVGGGAGGSVTVSVDSTVARKNSSNEFIGDQTINGSVILRTPGSGIQFQDGSFLNHAPAASPSALPTGSILLSRSVAPPPEGFVPTGEILMTSSFWSGRTPGFHGFFNAAANVGGRAYVFGTGSTDTFGMGSDEYDPMTDSWRVLSPMRTFRHTFGAAAIGTRIYVIGGATHSLFTDTPPFAPTSLVERYDTEGNTWTTETSLTVPRFASAVVATQDSIYVIGGFDAAGNALTSVERYSLATNSWAAVSPLPQPLARCSSVVINGKIYVFAGTSSYFQNANGAVYEYDPYSDSWSVRSSMPIATCDAAAGAVNGQAYVVGGRTGTFGAALSINEQYDPSSDTWIVLQSPPNSRVGAAGVGIGKALFVFGGHTALQGGATQSTPIVERFLAPTTLYVVQKQ